MMPAFGNCETSGVPRVARASRLQSCVSHAAPGGYPQASRTQMASVCIPQDAKYGRRDAHHARDMPSCFSSRQILEMA